MHMKTFETIIKGKKRVLVGIKLMSVVSIHGRRGRRFIDLLGLFITSEILAREGGGVVERGLSTAIRSSSLPGDPDEVGEMVAIGGNASPEPIRRG